MPIVKYNPFAEGEEFVPGFRVFQDSVNRLFSDNTVRPWSPAVDVFETENDVVLKADIPGIDMKDVEVLMENGTLALKGERKFERDEKNKGSV